MRSDRPSLADIEAAHGRCVDFLLGERLPDGHWAGELSTSALSTATAVSALHQMRTVRVASGQTGLTGLELSEVITDADRREVLAAGSGDVASVVDRVIQDGCHWLQLQQNADGGFGDTNRSHSNIATTFLVIAAWEMTGFANEAPEQMAAAWDYVNSRGSWDGLKRRYGKDKTFVVPIMSNCALAGLVEWSRIPVLPFEAAWLPQDWYRLAKMPVVSYAIPALVAIGQAQHHHAPTRNPMMRAIRNRARRPTLAVLRRMQPASGGYLEATPLTSFVLMNLAGIGLGDLPVARDCLRFLLDSILQDDMLEGDETSGVVANSAAARDRPAAPLSAVQGEAPRLSKAGSWPIDTNLATWVTGLSLVGLGRQGKLQIQLGTPCGSKSHCSKALATRTISAQAVRWLLACQHKGRHPFTGASPGGWGWTDLSGAVPDADDTPGAILALRQLDFSPRPLARLRHEAFAAMGAGLRWLCQLQNRDGGMPTFCRGWGQLPFDRSGTDLTAHALRAVAACTADLEEIQRCSGPVAPGRDELDRLIRRGRNYIEQQQHPDGHWLPLWFGNQDREEEDNPIYGTSKVLLAYAELGWLDSDPAQRALGYLRRHQNADGGWGGGQSTSYPAFSQGIGKHDSAESNRQANAGGSTIEESALAVESLVMCAGQSGSRVVDDRTIMLGVQWLEARMDPELLQTSWPIGFYFAKLWYHERLYPSIFATAALGAFLAAASVQDEQQNQATRRTTSDVT
ncbi:MAG: prenyltransferase/squalene oxidase repeat-containing protein [Aureliella sp.]